MPKTKIGREKQKASIVNIATKRLLKDWREINENPLPDIVASPIDEKNLFEWRANLKGFGKYDGGIFHIKLLFPNDYPMKPPTVELCTPIDHPNVFGKSICLDMLGEQWSTAYSVQSILLQLQSILLDDERLDEMATINPKQYKQKKKEMLDACKWAVEQSLRYSDPSVGHFPPAKPFPKFQKAQAKVIDLNEFTKSELVCYFSRSSYEEDVLGYGITFTKNIRTGRINLIQSTLELLSLRSFMNYSIRKTSTGDEFTHWMPIFIEPTHGKKALHLAKRAISMICTGNAKNFKPEQVMEVFPKILTTISVDIMTTQKKHGSIRALKVYCHYYRTFLEFAKEYPELLVTINGNIKRFIDSEENRHKDNTPNLGELLSVLPLSDYSWKDISNAYIEESFTRNVFWLLNKYKELEMDDCKEFDDNDRLKYSFETSKASQKLLMLNIFILENIARPGRNDIEQIRNDFDNRLGRLNPTDEDSCLETLKKINNVKNYLEFFNSVGMDEVKEDQIVELLKQSIKKSKVKGYHGSTIYVMSPEEFQRQTKKLDEYLTNDGQGNYTLESNEERWKTGCLQRWGMIKYPDYLSSHSNPWRKLYLQNNLQDLISSLNESCDFKYFHHVLEHSVEIPRLEIVMFNPDKLKSKYYFLTLVLTKLVNLDTLTISRGETGLGTLGFRALIKGLSNNQAKLENLILDSCDITASCVEELTKGSLSSCNLKRIALCGNPLGDQGANYLSKFLMRHENVPHLRELDLSHCGIQQTGAECIAEALLVKREITSLKFIGNPSQQGLYTILKHLGYSSCIEDVDFSMTRSTYPNGNSESLVKLLDLSTTLKKINLWKANGFHTLTQEVFNIIGKSKSLKEIDMAETKFKEVSLFASALKDNHMLETLNLSNNDINLSELFKLYTKLLLLHFENANKVRDFLDGPNSAIPPKLIHLQKLTLAKNNLTTNLLNPNIKEAISIGQIMKMCTNLSYLDLSGCKIDKYHIEGISAALDPKFKLPLKTLKLNNNEIGKTGLRPLASILKLNTTIEILDLSGNDLGVTGSVSLAEIITTNSSIKKLNLFSCFVQIEGIEIISKALQQNKTITDLDIGLNSAKERGAISIIEMLKTNSTLKRLGLKLNHLSDKTCTQIANIIANENTSSSIQYLALSGNSLSISTSSNISIILNSVKDRTVEFDLAKLVEVKDTEKQNRTIYLSPLPNSITIQDIKKFFYQHKCGAILNVYIHKHKNLKKTKLNKYAFVEFAHPDSLQLAIHLRYSNRPEKKSTSKVLKRIRGLNKKPSNKTKWYESKLIITKSGNQLHNETAKKKVKH